jgi:thiamine-phosphate pyrophosphorylase
MRDTYTPAVDRALLAAQRFARQENAPAVMPLHLLYGLLQEPEGRPLLMLREAGVEAAHALAAIPSLEKTPAADTEPLLLNRKVESTLRQAHALSELWGEGAISSDLVLIALLQQETELFERLQQWGLDPEALTAKVQALQQPLPLDEPLDLSTPVETMDLARILDASANRAREALRVIEDYCRFVLDDAHLSAALKTLRHELATILEEVPSAQLLAAREALRDVGTEIHTEQEQTRSSPEAVVQANLKRLQEALRSLEEYGKVLGPTLGRAFEQLRYRTYTIERTLLVGAESRRQLADMRLYMLVTAALCQGPLEWTIKEAAAGGVQVFQLREKTLNDRELLERAMQVRRWTREAGALFIVNDRPDIALLAGADGVHLGQEELPVKEARRILGANALIGVSTHNQEQLHQALRDGASYVGVGPTFPSATKEFADFPGLEFVRAAANATSLPAFCIGGITLANLPQVLQAGGRRAAVSHALCRSETPQALARAMRQLLDTMAVE